MIRVRPSRIVAALLTLSMPVALANCGSILYGAVNVPAMLGSYERRADVRYGPAFRQSLDVYVPDGAVERTAAAEIGASRPDATLPDAPRSGAARPIVVFWYGGIWIRGSKTDYRFVGAALANSGYVAVLPDYRLYPAARFPQFIEDGAHAVKWAHDHAREIGGDPDALFLMGHSAGAHIAATLALDSRYLNAVGGDTSWVRGWIGLSGPYALEMRMPLLKKIFSAPYSAADWQPVELVKGLSPSALLLQGADDGMTTPREARSLSERLHAAGVAVELHIYEHTSHFDTVAAFALPLRFSAPSLRDVRHFIDTTTAAPRLAVVAQ